MLNMLLGFAICRHSFKNYANGQLRLRIWCCQKHGLRRVKGKTLDILTVTKKKSRPDFLENCLALLQVSYGRMSGL